jgi:hypothetical protein
MKLKPSETALVIAGAWNSAIVTPEWIIRHCLATVEGQEVRVQAFVPAGTGVVVEFPRFAIGDLSFTTRPDAFLLIPAKSDEATLNLVESVALRTLEQLTHTPIGGFGQNFEFEDTDPDPTLLGAFTAAQQDLTDAKPAEWQVKGSAIATSFEVGQLTVNVQQNFRPGKLTVRFNFHHNVNNAAACASVIRREHGENSMFQNLEVAKQLVTAIYGELQNEDESVPVT